MGGGRPTSPYRAAHELEAPVNLGVAVDRAAEAASRRGLSDAAFRACVTGTTHERRPLVRALNRIRRRQAVLVTEPAIPGASSVVSPLPDPSLAQVWAEDPSELEAASRRESPCPGCEGRGVGCPTCDGGGRVLARLTVTSELRQVVVSDDAHGLDGYARLLEPADFDAPNVSLPGEIESDSELAPEACPAELLAPVDTRLDRIESIRVQKLATSVVRVGYSLARRPGFVDVSVHDGRVLEQSDFEPIARRRWLSFGAGATAGALGFVALLVYASRDAWFVAHGNLPLLGPLALGAAVAAGVGTAELTLLAPARDPRRLALAFGAALAALLGMGLAWGSKAPSIDRAVALLAAGREADARSEAHALIRLDSNAGAARELLDELHRRRLTRSQGLDALASVVAEPWQTEEARLNAQATLTRAVLAAADQAYAKGARFELERLASPTSPGDAQSREYARSLVQLLELADCIARVDLTCIARDLGRRVPPAVQRHEDALRTVASGALRKELDQRHAQRVDGPSAASRQQALKRVIELTKSYEKLTGRELVPGVVELEKDDSLQIWEAAGEEAQAKLRAERLEKERKRELESFAQVARRSPRRAQGALPRGRHRAAAAAGLRPAKRPEHLDGPLALSGGDSSPGGSSRSRTGASGPDTSVGGASTAY